MKIYAGLRLHRAVIVGAVALCVVPAAAVAAVAPGRVPLPQRQIRSSVGSAAHPWHAVRTGSHFLYGTIAAMRGGILTIRLRSGRPQSVDASAAIANGDYSAPLFIGKMVSIDGDVRGTIFTAAHVFRLDSLANLRPDG